MGDEQASGSTQQPAVPLPANLYSAAAPALKQLPWPRMRSEPKTSADDIVALARALQASRFAASADAVEASCEAATAPTLEKFVSDR